MRWLPDLQSGLWGWALVSGAFYHLGFTLLNFLRAFSVPVFSLWGGFSCAPESMVIFFQRDSFLGGPEWTWTYKNSFFDFYTLSSL